MKIKELRNGMRRVNITGKVIKKSATREVRSKYKNETYKISDVVVKDDTGEIKLTLWNEQIDKVNMGDIIKIENGYITSFRGEIQLSVGRYGTLSSSSNPSVRFISAQEG